MTEKELANLGIMQWSQIAAKYGKPNLLLGNGFSMKLYPKFSYKSLFDNFLLKCVPAYIPLFKQLQTTNFETILDYLSYAEKVNTILSIETKRINEAIETLRNGLIDSINDIHPRKSQIDWDHLDRITNSLQDFGEIYTTNYDMFLYHIILKSNDKYRINKKHCPYQDYFWGSYNTEFKEFKNFQNYTQYKHIYYLHGSLFLFNRNTVDLKLMLNDESTELLDLVTSRIKANDFPLFVSEGTSFDKLESINKSNYLKFCLEKLKKTTEPILVFGNSLSDVDKHIFDALIVQPKDIIISIYTGGRDETQLKHEKYAMLAKFNTYTKKTGKSIEFIDSNSLFN